jgi:hypothetical protein
MLPVIVELLGRLCLLEAVSYISLEGLARLHVLGNGGHPRLPRLIRADGNLSPKSERIKNCNELNDYLQIPLGNDSTS